MNAGKQWVVAVSLAMMITGSLAPERVFAHCDGLDGPVVGAARKALDSGDVNGVLIWVKKDGESEIREAFRQALAVRKLGADARALADRFFFETLVRVHRAGEGAPYTGLKPAGRDLGPAIPAGDRALATGDAAPLLDLLVTHVRESTKAEFDRVMARRDHAPADLAAGREWVEAYVSFIHHVERVYEATKKPAGGHSPEGGHPGD